MAHIINIDDYLRLPAPKSVILEGEVVRLVVMGSQFHIPCTLDKVGSYRGVLQYEPTNKVDAETIKVCLEDGKQVGYVSRKENVMLKEIISGNITRCQIEVFCITQDDKPVDMVAFYSVPISNVDAARVHDGELAKVESELKVQREKRLAYKLKELKNRKTETECTDAHVVENSNQNFMSEIFVQLREMPYIVLEETLYRIRDCKTVLHGNYAMRISVSRLKETLPNNWERPGKYKGYVVRETTRQGRLEMKVCLKNNMPVGYLYSEEIPILEKIMTKDVAHCNIEFYSIMRGDKSIGLVAYCNVFSYDYKVALTYSRDLAKLENGIRYRQNLEFTKGLYCDVKPHYETVNTKSSKSTTNVILHNIFVIIKIVWRLVKLLIKIVLFPLYAIYKVFAWCGDSGYYGGDSYSKDYNSNDNSSASSSSYNHSYTSRGLTSTDRFDWETFEKSIESDEYMDFKW